MKAKGDFSETSTLEHNAHPRIIRALKGRTDFVEGPNPDGVEHTGVLDHRKTRLGISHPEGMQDLRQHDTPAG